MPERVVFDTNVIISGLIWRGEPYRCLLMARAGLCQALYCDEGLAELTEKLRSKFGFSVERIRGVAFDVRSHFTRVQIKGTLRVVLRDTDDDKFVECAVTGGASTIVSSDRHLLDLINYHDVRIVTPNQFIEESWNQT